VATLLGGLRLAISDVVGLNGASAGAVGEAGLYKFNPVHP
jgi:hypothetical protein